MNRSILTKLSDSWKSFNRNQPEEEAIDTLSSFVKDAEHEMLTVVTALQAHIDLLHNEQIANKLSVDRFAILNRTVDRLISDTSELVCVSELAHTPLAVTKLTLDELVHEIADETRSAFTESQVSLSCDIPKDTTLTGNAGSLKIMIKKIVLAVLHKCHAMETIKIVGLSKNERVSLSVDIGFEANRAEFTPWQLGKLRLFPCNGDGITLASVDAMARLYNGNLSMSTAPDQRHGFKLNFKA